MNEETENINKEVPEENTYPQAAETSHLIEDTDLPAENEKPQKPYLLILNIVLLIGLVILYYLYFSEKKEDNVSMNQVVAKASKGSMSVAFVNNDSILANYDLVKKLKKELEARGNKLNAEVAAKQAAFDKDAAYFQDQVQKKAISEQSAQEIYAKLSENQQQIYDLRDKYSSMLQQSEQDMNVALLDSVMNFLKRYNTRYKFDYILGFNKVGNILYANDTLDITRDVIKELNQEYQSKHKDN